MEDLRQWQGRWENFESYIDSSDPEMNEVWRQAQQAVDSMPGKPPMFAEGVRNFWKKVCATEGEGVELPLGEVEIQADQEKRALSISWRDREGRDLGSGIYRWIGTVAPGLEGKENLLFAAENQGGSWPFGYFLAMPPVPAGSARESGGLLRHFHFQFAPGREILLREDGTLQRPMWYPTLCDGDGTLTERCNIVRALHRLPPLPTSHR